MTILISRFLHKHSVLQGLRVEHPEDVEPALLKAKGIDDGPVVIDFIVDEEENVFPMVPAGKGLGDVIRGLS